MPRRKNDSFGTRGGRLQIPRLLTDLRVLAATMAAGPAVLVVAIVLLCSRPAGGSAAPRGRAGGPAMSWTPERRAAHKPAALLRTFRPAHNRAQGELALPC